ncbi:MAG: hypothetical protein HC911_00735 [Chloroflexaceae bacterium]|nr:hypothetical protein [Chloroflexaceae bacterium]
MTSQYALIVEGRDDEAVCRALFQSRGFSKQIVYERLDGYDSHKLRVTFSAVRKSVAIAVGIILDADEDINGRWQSLGTLLTAEGYVNLPKHPDPDGTILKHPDPDMPTVGVWLMPNNQTAGKLEDFLAQLVPSGDLLWSYADTTIHGLPEQRFRATDRSKAHIHTWLAWQAAPGKPFGQAMMSGYLAVGQPAANQFLVWSHQLFT